MGKRTKQPRQWILTWWRSVGEFKNGERRMLQRTFKPRPYRTLQEAMKGREHWRTMSSARGLIHKKGRKPRKIIELEVFPEDYSGE